MKKFPVNSEQAKLVYEYFENYKPRSYYLTGQPSPNICLYDKENEVFYFKDGSILKSYFRSNVPFDNTGKAKTVLADGSGGYNYEVLGASLRDIVECLAPDFARHNMMCCSLAGYYSQVAWLVAAEYDL